MAQRSSFTSRFSAAATAVFGGAVLVGCVAQLPANSADAVSNTPPITVLLVSGGAGRDYAGKRMGLMADIEGSLKTLDSMMGKGVLSIRNLDLELTCGAKEDSCSEQAQLLLENNGADALVYSSGGNSYFNHQRYPSVRPNIFQQAITKKWPDFVPLVAGIVEGQTLAARDAQSLGRLALLEGGLSKLQSRERFEQDASKDIKGVLMRSLGDIHAARALLTGAPAEYQQAVNAYDRAVVQGSALPLQADFLLRSALAQEAQAAQPFSPALLAEARTRYARALALRTSAASAQAKVDDIHFRPVRREASGRGLSQAVFLEAELGQIRCDTKLAIAQKDPKRLEALVVKQQELLTRTRREIDRYVWANEQSNLCELELARARAAGAEKSPAELVNRLFEQAVDACRNAAGAYGKRYQPALYAQTRARFADVVAASAEVTGSPRSWELAAEEYAEALNVMVPEFYAKEWPELQYKWARALIEQGVAERLRATLEKGLEAVHSAESKVPAGLVLEFQQLEKRAQQALAAEPEEPEEPASSGVPSEVVQPD